ncbi:hypothetical protein SAMN04489716_6755 [Actinoplanes derwentensis]|uniref:Uncharacterized protein n=1 Tax=Actinoplanes derwentensis TaxID=113562 RepID=A0A1H2CT63_9ACTN|nr:hypothetical protein SAMN04489716_6755 [Actinoplanes derwentensis]
MGVSPALIGDFLEGTTAIGLPEASEVTVL